MSTRPFFAVILTLVSVLAISGVVGAADLSPAGITVDVDPWVSDLGTAVIDVQWLAGGDEVFVAIKGPEGVEAVVEGGHLITLGDRFSLGKIAAGESLTVEIFGLREGKEAFLSLERKVGNESFQVVARVGIIEGRPLVIDDQSYRIYEKEVEPLDDVDRSVEVNEHAVVLRSTERTLVIESLQSKVAAVLLGESTADFDVPISAPTSCGPNYLFSTISHMNVGGAPAGSITTNLAVHIEMSHWDSSQMTIAYSENDFYHDPANAGQNGRFLWLDEAAQVDLDKTWTRDKFNQELPGIGRDPNGWFQLWFVDCTGGAVGTVTYWSVEATYDAADDVDLSADNVSVSPATAAPGDDIEVVWDGHISGTTSIAGGFTTRIYLSNDTNITTADTVLATIAEAAASDPGDTFGDGAPGRTVTLPPGASDGTKYIGIIVDYNDAVDESNESNNTAWDAITIDSSSSVDLVADSITPLSGSVAAGASVNVNWFGHADAGNSGDIPGNFTVGFYLSNDATVTTGDTLLDRETMFGPTSPGESFGSNNRPVLIPGGTSAGTKYLGLIVDDTGSVAETNENNNIATSSITITGGGGGGQPDLVTSACSASPSSLEEGDAITVNWTERNQGDADASAFVTKVFLSSNQTWEGGGTDHWIGQRTLGPYAAGFQQSLSLSGNIPGGIADGTWYVLVVTDANDQVAESSESNNLCVSTITIGSGGTPGGSDRWLVPAAASATGFGGSDWRTQMAITNSTGQTRQATIYYVSDSASWPGVLLSGPISIGPRRSYYLDDILATLRPTAGLVYVVFDEAGPVVTSRTYNRASDGSTFGQGIPGIPMGGIAPDELILPMVHSGAGRFHTNLGLVQASTGSMTVEISIYTAGGSLLATQQRTVVDGWDQINDVFDKMGLGAASIEGGWIRVRLVGGSPDAWTCYASVVDKETGDPTYVAGVEAE